MTSHQTDRLFLGTELALAQEVIIAARKETEVDVEGVLQLLESVIQRTEQYLTKYDPTPHAEIKVFNGNQLIRR